MESGSPTDQGPALPIVDARERRVYESLPEEVTIYRTCDRKRLSGMCWSLKRNGAERSHLPKVQSRKAGVDHGTVRKSEVLAVLLGQKEWEIVTLDA